MTTGRINQVSIHSWWLRKASTAESLRILEFSQSAWTEVQIRATYWVRVTTKIATPLGRDTVRLLRDSITILRKTTSITWGPADCNNTVHQVYEYDITYKTIRNEADSIFLASQDSAFPEGVQSSDDIPIENKESYVNLAWKKKILNSLSISSAN